MTVRLYVASPLSGCPPLCCSRTAPEVSENKGSYASRFYRLFLQSSKSCLLLLVALPDLTDTVAQLLAWRLLLWLSMTWRRRYLTQSNFLSTRSLAWFLVLHLLFCFSQEKPLRRKEIHTYTHTYTHIIIIIIIIITAIIITLFKVDKNINVIQVTLNKIAAISIDKR